MTYHDETNGNIGIKASTDRSLDARAIRIVTLNLGFLCCEPFAGFTVSLTPAHPERLAAAPRMIRDLNADVVALQELYSSTDRDALISKLSDIYPFVAESPRRRPFIGSGLIMLSRFPISGSQFKPVSGTPFWLWPFWRQGILIVDIEFPEIGKTRFANVHLAANLPGHPSESVANIANRTREIDQLLSITQSDCTVDLLVGDFNASETIASHNYRRILDFGYADLFTFVHAGTNKKGTTWDPANKLNSSRRYRDTPAQRIDHIFVRKSKPIQSADIEVVMNEPSILTPLGSTCLSDHYGMMAKMVFEPKQSSEITFSDHAPGDPFFK